MDVFDRSARASNRLLAGLLISGAVLALLLVLVAALADLGARDGEAASLPRGVVATIDDVAVTEAEWTAAVEGVPYLRALSALSLEDARERAEATGDELWVWLAERTEAAVRVQEETADELVAFVTLVGDQAALAHAAEHDIVPDAARVAEFVEEQRSVMPEAERERIFAAVDEDWYWEEFMPRTGRLVEIGRAPMERGPADASLGQREVERIEFAMALDIQLASTLATHFSADDVRSHLEHALELAATAPSAR